MRTVQQLPDGKDWLYEVKFDGYRCLAGRDSTGVTLWSRRANVSQTSSRQTQERVSTCRQTQFSIARSFVLVANGRISFNQLQHHRSQAQAILFYAFDVISIEA